MIDTVTNKFTSHVFPGETLIVSLWKENGVIIFQTTTKERGKVVINGYMTLKPQAKL